MYCIELANDKDVPQEQRKMHLDIIIGGIDVIEKAMDEAGIPTEERERYGNMYKEKIIDFLPNGLYEKFKDTEFEEMLGEYKDSENNMTIPKRVITYKVHP